MDRNVYVVILFGSGREFVGCSAFSSKDEAEKYLAGLEDDVDDLDLDYGFLVPLILDDPVSAGPATIN